MLYIAFHRTSTSPIPMKPVPLPLGIITTILQSHDGASSPLMKFAFIMTMTFYQFPGSGRSSRVYAQIHILSCPYLMMDVLPAQCAYMFISILSLMTLITSKASISTINYGIDLHQKMTCFQLIIKHSNCISTVLHNNNI